MLAVAGLDHAPDADELLQRRLAGGWRPTASALRDGEKIEGHAAGSCAARPRDE